MKTMLAAAFLTLALPAYAATHPQVLSAFGLEAAGAGLQPDLSVGHGAGEAPEGRRQDALANKRQTARLTPSRDQNNSAAPCLQRFKRKRAVSRTALHTDLTVGRRTYFSAGVGLASHFMVVVFSHSALVFGASAANAGALMANRNPR